MTTAITFLLVLLYYEVFRTALFLMRFMKLKKHGIGTSGKIISWHFESNSIIHKNERIPVIEFINQDAVRICGKPLHSFFNYYNIDSLNKEVTLFYDQAEPKKFVVWNRYEPIIIVAFFLITIGITCWLVFQGD